MNTCYLLKVLLISLYSGQNYQHLGKHFYAKTESSNNLEQQKVDIENEAKDIIEELNKCKSKSFEIDLELTQEKEKLV